MTGLPIIEAENLSKTFSGRQVVREVDLDVSPGEVHGLAGQNGSGKSTIIKMLAGYHAPDHGARLRVRGETVHLPLSPTDPGRLGLAFVHQDLGLIDSASVVENLRINRYQTRFGWRIPWRAERRMAAAALGRFGLEIDPETKVGALREVERALLAIARALDRLSHVESGLLVLDEPTAYLPRDSVDMLFEAVRAVAASGFGVLFVSHRLEEVLGITDRVSILRDGMLVARAQTSQLRESDLIGHILGFSLDQLYPEHHEGTRADVVADVRQLSGRVVQDLSMEVRRGEILGLTGLAGMGYEEVPYLLFGAHKAHTGDIKLGDRLVRAAALTPPTAMKLGMALLPADRGRAGGVGGATLSENVSLASLANDFDTGYLHRRAERRRVHRILESFRVTPREPSRAFATLSGGNQQKALVGKWFETAPRLFLLHEPTQGVDVGARREIFEHIRRAADAGTALVLASSEYEDLAHLCDRVLVFRNGRVAAELRGENLTEERIVEQCFLDEPSASRGQAVEQ